MSALALYDAMVTAIAECARVDEVKDIRDKAVALEAYYRQARNLEAEREACNVRLRAERRVGELLKDLARNQTVGLKQGPLSAEETTGPSPYAETLAATGMSRQSASRFQALANIPQDEFDAVLAAPEKPSANAVLARRKVQEAGQSKYQVSTMSLWIWGRLRDFERERYLDASPDAIFYGMTEAMRADVIRLAPLVADFLTTLERAYEPA